MLLVLTSAKGAPGVTTAGLALAAAWPSQQSPVFLELDPGGGDLIADFGLDAEPGLMSLAAAARREHRPQLVREHAQQLPGGLLVVPAPSGAEQAATSVDVLLSSAPWEAMHQPPTRSEDPGAESPATPAKAERDVLIVDAGRLPTRLSRGDGLARLLLAADVVLVVTRNDPRGLVHTAARLDQLAALAGPGRRVRLLVVNAGQYPAEEVTRGLGVPVAGVLPVDARAARALSGLPVRRPAALRRSPLLRAARDVARRLAASAQRTGAPASPSPPAAEEATDAVPPGSAAGRKEIAVLGAQSARSVEEAR